jgi:hypothetical protein
MYIYIYVCIYIYEFTFPVFRTLVTQQEDAPWGKAVERRYRADPAPFEWLESFVELESLIKEAEMML